MLTAPVHAAAIRHTLVRAGPTISPNDPGGTELLVAEIAITPETAPRFLTYLGDDPFFTFNVGQIGDANPPDGTVRFIGAGVNWQYQPSKLPEAMFVEIGSAMNVRSEDEIRGDDHGGKVFFLAQVTLGANLGTAERWRTGIRWQHESNGNLDEPNPGVNALLFEFGYSW